MNYILDASGILVVLGGFLAFVYEMWALDKGNGKTISDILERWIGVTKPWGTILIVLLEFGLQLFGLHILGVGL